MLYLVELDKAYKVGYSNEVHKRVSSFRTSNLKVNLISTREGDKYHESLIHNALNEYNIRNQLYQINPEVIKIFNNYELEIEKDKKSNDKISKLEKENYDLKIWILDVLTNKLKIIENIIKVRDLLCEIPDLEHCLDFYEEQHNINYLIKSIKEENEKLEKMLHNEQI